MDLYQCHKRVHAAKIVATLITGASTAMLKLENGECESVSQGWITRHAPAAGGYLVRYEDGYLSYSPAAAFESGYTKVIDG